MTDGIASMLVGDDGFVPKERYVSQAFLDLEMERLWPHVWQVACREEQVAEPGQFVEYTIGDQSVLVVRTDDGRIAAHHNACLHRGTRLASGCGAFDEGNIRCRYHAWCYALDGRLIEVVDAHEFEPLPEGLKLGAVQCETWGGFVFVNLDAGAAPLLEYLDPLPKLLAGYHLERLRFRAYQTTILPANWKVVVDAFNEAYHVQGTHPQLLPWTDDVSIAYEQLGIHAHYGRLPEARRELRPSPRLGLSHDEYDEGQILAGLVGGLGRLFLGEEMAIVDELRASPRRPGTTLLQEFQSRRRDLLAARGLDVSDLSLDQMTSADDVYCFPNLVGPIYPGSAIVFRVRPNGLDPDSSIKDIWTLEWPSAAHTEGKWEQRFYPDWTEKDWGEISNQDYANMLEVQTGMKSRAFRGPRLNARQESNILHMHRVIDRYLTEPR
ncbi:MAG TPA: aromatic ring-hydroxylating dioxygenase subunit alpha [Acidimicrobiales bacterium]|jgi:phenylpropionate dioxygenase-like ring-hydroxylating dioxygenase large terminal subunit